MGPATGIDGVTIAIARDPALVRTVRLVAAAVARRATADEDFVEEVRLAVGEACALLVGRRRADRRRRPEPVEVQIRASTTGFAVTVSGRRSSAAGPGYEDIDGVDPWALLRGLSEDLDDTEDAGTTTLECPGR